MKFLYGVKGCSHCDSREDCPKELKNSKANLMDTPKKIEEKHWRGMKRWLTFCADFFRLVRLTRT